ncbi:MAG: hypothetical protein ACOY9J_04980 [Pseudomonadota bacterium]
MSAEIPDNRPATTADDNFAAIPILLEPVPQTSVPLSAGTPLVRTLGRVDQQSLFDEPAPPNNALPPRSRTVARKTAAPELLRAADHILRARAPAIVDEIVAAHAARLNTELRQRLQNELESLLKEMSGNTAPRELTSTPDHKG